MNRIDVAKYLAEQLGSPCCDTALKEKMSEFCTAEYGCCSKDTYGHADNMVCWVRALRNIQLTTCGKRLWYGRKCRKKHRHCEFSTKNGKCTVSKILRPKVCKRRK